MKISILHPSRSRIEQAYLAYRHWTLKMSGTTDYEYILSIDVTDPQAVSYLNGAFHQTPNDRVIINDNRNVVMAANEAAKVSTGDILILISDDFSCFDNWDTTITEALKNKSGLLKTFDGVQRWIVTLPIMTRDYYQECGYIYYPKYEHMFCDTDQTHRADLRKKLIIRDDIIFRHDHYSVNGQPKDEVSKKADKTWDQGEKVYLDRCRNQFGIPKPVNIYDLSPEATKAGHVAWLKKKFLKGVRA